MSPLGDTSTGSLGTGPAAGMLTSPLSRSKRFSGRKAPDQTAGAIRPKKFGF